MVLWRAIASQLSMCLAKPDINMECWLAIAHHEKIDNLEKSTADIIPVMSSFVTLLCILQIILWIVSIQACLGRDLL